MNTPQHDASVGETSDELVEETPDESSVATEALQGKPTTTVSNAEQGSINNTAWTYRGWQTIAGTLVLVLALLVVTTIYVRCPQQIALSDQLSDEDKVLAGFVTRFFCVAMVGVIARWLMAAASDPGPEYNLLEYLRRWLADAVSTALIVAVVLLILRSVSIQLGTITVTLAKAGQELLMGLAFVLGYFVNRAREMLHSISELTFLQRETKNKAQEQRRSDHGNDGTGNRD